MNQVDGSDDPSEAWVDARTAAALLGVKRATLYAYVSRGRVRSRALGGSRERAYARSDLERLRAQRDARAGHGPVAAGALRWGEPVLDSAITEITARGPRYRGHDAVGLAERGVSFERVAELLFGGALPRTASWTEPLPLAPPSRLAASIPAEARPIDAAALALPAQAMRDPARIHAGPEAARRVARRLVRGLVASFGLLAGAAVVRRAADEPTVAGSLAVAFGRRPTQRARALIDAALVLCADHELNASSFACRVAASAGADLYACACAALATLSGAHHGGMSERVGALVEEVGTPERAPRVVRERLRRGESIPGFGHPLYPEGDPRAAPLLARARAAAPRSARIRTLDALVDTMDLVDGGRPTLDVGLCAVADALGLPPGGAAALFAGGRAAGWIAHALEQGEAGYLLRPRARFVGPAATRA
ncbi:MAG TPA: citrate synthase [Sandaracinaceae bacterium LLY-WYZ-13_1]|nr:citrate synthase [Sandaracinaceae bacterium LLY-WYZ-13_1]